MTIETFMRQLAPVYGSAEHTPDSAMVSAAYTVLKRELWRQLLNLHVRTGIRSIEYVNIDPYSSAVAMFSDIHCCNRLKVYTLADLPYGHPLAERAPNGQTFNSVFRAVHDALAHYPERNDFSMLGEFRAFQAHARTLSPMAQWAVATETIGQQAYMRFGPTPEAFAPQKATLLPYASVELAMELF